LFENQNSTVLSDALKNISGVNVQNGFGVHDFFLIRGFDSLTSGLVLTDGAPEPEVSFYNLYNINRIEVLKGPGAFLYGGNPLSGAVNLSRKQPIFDNFARASGSYGQFQTLNGTIDAGFKLPNTPIAFRFNGLWQESDNYRDHKDNESYAVNPSVTWQLSDTGSLTANFEYVRSDFRPDTGLPLQFIPTGQGTPPVIQIPDVPRTRSFQSPFDKSEQETHRIRLDYNQRISKVVTLRNKFYFTDLEWSTNGTLLNGAFPRDNQGNFNVFRTLQFLDDEQKFWGNQIEALFAFRTGSVSHRLLTGFEAARLSDDFELLVTQPNPVDLFNFVETIIDFQLLLKIPLTLAEARSFVFAPYLVNQTSFSEKVQLFYGGRLDVINYDDRRIDLMGFSDILTPNYVRSNTKRNYKKFSPMFGLVVSPAKSISLYANAGQSFAPPSTLTIGAPKPEESTQLELGAKTTFFDGKLKTTLAFYHLRKENIGIPDQTGITRENGDQRSRGIELEITAQPHQGWYTFLTYAYTDAELTEFREVNFGAQQIDDLSGNAPPFAPQHIFNFWTSKEFKTGIGIGAGVRHVSSQFIAADNQFEIDGYVTFDAMVSYSFRNFRWSLNFKNITDREYETRGFGTSSVTPANPFAAYSRLDFAL
ncbi:MAG: TonB-dependent receptor, partial [bacterium]